MKRRLAPPPKTGRPGLTDLPRPHDRFDLTKTPEFETLATVTDWDRRNARALRRLALAKPRKAARYRALADRIDPDVTSDPQTMASQRYVRAIRINVIGAIWAMLDDA